MDGGLFGTLNVPIYMNESMSRLKADMIRSQNLREQDTLGGDWGFALTREARWLSYFELTSKAWWLFFGAERQMVSAVYMDG